MNLFENLENLVKLSSQVAIAEKKAKIIYKNKAGSFPANASANRYQNLKVEREKTFRSILTFVQHVIIEKIELEKKLQKYKNRTFWQKVSDLF